MVKPFWTYIFSLQTFSSLPGRYKIIQNVQKQEVWKFNNTGQQTCGFPRTMKLKKKWNLENCPLLSTFPNCDDFSPMARALVRRVEYSIFNTFFRTSLLFFLVTLREVILLLTVNGDAIRDERWQWKIFLRSVKHIH